MPAGRAAPGRCPRSGRGDPGRDHVRWRRAGAVAGRRGRRRGRHPLSARRFGRRPRTVGPEVGRVDGVPEGRSVAAARPSAVAVDLAGRERGRASGVRGVDHHVGGQRNGARAAEAVAKPPTARAASRHPRSSWRRSADRSGRDMGRAWRRRRLTACSGGPEPADRRNVVAAGRPGRADRPQVDGAGRPFAGAMRARDRRGRSCGGIPRTATRMARGRGHGRCGATDATCCCATATTWCSSTSSPVEVAHRSGRSSGHHGDAVGAPWPRASVRPPWRRGCRRRRWSRAAGRPRRPRRRPRRSPRRRCRSRRGRRRSRGRSGRTYPPGSPVLGTWPT
jgi:hypothetical protein